MNYLNELYNDARDGYIATWCKNSGSVNWFSLADLASSQHYMNEAAILEDVYFGWSVQKEPVSGRGDAHNAIAIPGFFLDVDLKSSESGVHSKNEFLPEKVEDFLALVDEVGFPRPTAIRNSGNGAYLDWIFEKPMRISDANRDEIVSLSKRFQRAFIAAAKSKNWSLDNVGDLARVTRLPGTLNHKTTPPKNVTLLHFDPARRIGITKMREALELLEKRVSTTSKLFSSNRSAVTSAPIRLSDDLDADVNRIAAGCGWMRDLIDRRAALSEPEWYAAASILGHCKDGPELFHRFSKDDPRYDQRETEEKLKHAMQTSARRCLTIADQFQNEACRSCAFRHSGLRTPLRLKSVPSRIGEIAARHVFDLSLNSYVELSSMKTLSERSFNNKFKPLFGDGNPHNTLISKDMTMRVSSIDYCPGNDGLFLADGSEWKLNKWRPADIVPAPGDTSILHQHITHVFPDAVAHKHFLDALAFHMQNPFEKIRHVILIIGKQGLGKSFFNSLLMTLCGEKNVYLAESTDLTSGWTASLANREVIVLEELDAFERREFYEMLKRWVTDEKVTVNEKHIPRYEARTPRLMIGFTNHSVPTALGDGDRRFFVYQSPSDKKEPEYYTKLFTDGLAQAPAFLAELLARDVSGFSPDAEPPMTEAKSNIIAWSKPNVQQDLALKIEQGGRPFDKDFGTVDAVLGALNNDGRRGRPYSMQEVTRAFKEMGIVQYPSQIRVNNTRPRLWIWHNQEHWLNATADELREAFTSAPSAGGAEAA